MLRIAVFCGSYTGNDLRFAEHARCLGAYIAEKQAELVYGGTHIGIMGILADSVLAGGGSVEGIIPDFLEEMQVAHQGLTRLIRVQDMDARKKGLLKPRMPFWYFRVGTAPWMSYLQPWCRNSWEPLTNL